MTPRGVDFDPRDPLIRALRALPQPRAPRTLAPRVMAVVRARGGRTAPPTWFDWPVGWQVSSVVAAVAVMAAVVLGWPMAVALVQPVSGEVSARLAGALHRAAVILSVSAVFFRAVWYPLVLPFLAFVTVMTVVCATVAAMLDRVALGGVSR